MEHNADLLRRLEAIAKGKGISLPVLAIAWVLHQGDDIIPIPSSKSRKHLEDNLSALDVRFTADELAEIEAICRPTRSRARAIPSARWPRLISDGSTDPSVPSPRLYPVAMFRYDRSAASAAEEGTAMPQPG